MPLRVVAGRSRGRLMKARLPGSVRPTSDRVREAIFSIVGSLEGVGGVAGLAVADLFCGSGALGIEALSRGAASVVFVDRDRAALDAVRENLVTTGLADEPVALVQGTLPGWLARAGANERVDLAFCDPPYAFDAWDELLAGLAGLGAGVVVAESAADREIAAPEGWMIATTRHYGGTLVTVIRRASSTR